MRLFHQVHNEGELFLPTTLFPLPDLKESVHNNPQPKFSPVERVFSATEIQRDIAAERIQ